MNQTLEIAFPASNKGLRATARSFSDFELGPYPRLIYLSVWAAAGFVLLVACANLANLTLVRTLNRARELSTRIAFGAGTGRMARQLFTESALLAIGGGGLGWCQLALRVWIAATWLRYVVLDYPPGVEIVVWWAAVTAATAALFGFIPILRVIRTDIGSGLKSAARGATMSRGTKHLSAALVAGQMALAIVLLSGAGVLVRSLWNIVGAEVGVRGADRILVGEVHVPREQYPSTARNGYWDRLQANLKSIPGRQ